MRRFVRNVQVLANSFLKDPVSLINWQFYDPVDFWVGNRDDPMVICIRRKSIKMLIRNASASSKRVKRKREK